MLQQAASTCCTAMGRMSACCCTRRACSGTSCSQSVGATLWASLKVRAAYRALQSLSVTCCRVLLCLWAPSHAFHVHHWHLHALRSARVRHRSVSFVVRLLPAVLRTGRCLPAAGEIAPSMHEAVHWRIAVFWRKEQEFFMGDIVNYDPESDVYEVHYDDGELVSVLPMSSDGLRASMACHKRGLSEHRQGALAWRAMPCRNMPLAAACQVCWYKGLMRHVKGTFWSPHSCIDCTPGFCKALESLMTHFPAVQGRPARSTWSQT